MRDMTMSGEAWIGNRPVDWEENKIKYVAPIHNERASTNEGYIGLENIESWTGKLLTSDSVATGESIAFQKDDVLFGKLRPYLAKSFLAKQSGCGSTELLVMRPDNISPEYLAYILRSKTFVDCVDVSTYGAKMPRANGEFIMNLRVPLPPLSEQQAIARYLDSKCAAIDEAIDRHRKIIEKLEEYRTKVVSHVVIHGLRKDVEEKSYPVIGKCPVHWKVSRLKFSAIIVRGGSPRPIDDYITDKDGFNWIKISDATGNGKYINSTKQQIIPEGLSKTRLVHSGTLLLTNSMSFGHPYILNIDGCIHDGWLAFSDYEGIEQDYLYYYLMSDSAMNQFVRTVEGSVVNNLNIEKVKNSLITIPPTDEQKTIVAYLDKQNMIIDNAIKSKQEIVEKLEEYRKSIIYNAVTGKIDCRTEESA